MLDPEGAETYYSNNPTRRMQAMLDDYVKVVSHQDAILATKQDEMESFGWTWNM